jgi:hypothetical protein
MSVRQQIIDAVETTLREIRDPKPVLVTREPFEPEKLAITQFPALLISFIDEERETMTMGLPALGRRAGNIRFEIRSFVRGTELDRRRNDILEAVEDALDLDRYLGLKQSGVIDSQLELIEAVPRLAPLAEQRMVYRVRYNYLRGAQ